MQSAAAAAAAADMTDVSIQMVPSGGELEGPQAPPPPSPSLFMQLITDPDLTHAFQLECNVAALIVKENFKALVAMVKSPHTTPLSHVVRAIQLCVDGHRGTPELLVCERLGLLDACMAIEQYVHQACTEQIHVEGEDAVVAATLPLHQHLALLTEVVNIMACYAEYAWPEVRSMWHMRKEWIRHLGRILQWSASFSMSFASNTVRGTWLLDGRVNAFSVIALETTHAKMRDTLRLMSRRLSDVWLRLCWANILVSSNQPPVIDFAMLSSFIVMMKESSPSSSSSVAPRLWGVGGAASPSVGAASPSVGFTAVVCHILQHDGLTVPTAGHVEMLYAHLVDQLRSESRKRNEMAAILISALFRCTHAWIHEDKNFGVLATCGGSLLHALLVRITSAIATPTVRAVTCVPKRNVNPGTDGDDDEEEEEEEPHISVLLRALSHVTSALTNMRFLHGVERVDLMWTRWIDIVRSLFRPWCMDGPSSMMVESVVVAATPALMSLAIAATASTTAAISDTKLVEPKESPLAKQLVRITVSMVRITSCIDTATSSMKQLAAHMSLLTRTQPPLPVTLQSPVPQPRLNQRGGVGAKPDPNAWLVFQRIAQSYGRAPNGLGEWYRDESRSCRACAVQWSTWRTKDLSANFIQIAKSRASLAPASGAASANSQGPRKRGWPGGGTDRPSHSPPLPPSLPSPPTPPIECPTSSSSPHLIPCNDVAAATDNYAPCRDVDEDGGHSDKENVASDADGPMLIKIEPRTESSNEDVGDDDNDDDGDGNDVRAKRARTSLRPTAQTAKIVDNYVGDDDDVRICKLVISSICTADGHVFNRDEAKTFIATSSFIAPQRGLFAGQFIAAGRLITWYTGKHFLTRKTVTRHQNSVDESRRTYFFDVDDGHRVRYYIDGAQPDPRFGGWEQCHASFINHRPSRVNCEFQVLKMENQHGHCAYRTAIFATRPIEQGQELYLHYGEAFDRMLREQGTLVE